MSEFRIRDRRVSYAQDCACMKALSYYDKNWNPCHFQRHILRYRHLDLVGFNKKDTIHEYWEFSIQPVDLDRVRLYAQYFCIVLRYLDTNLEQDNFLSKYSYRIPKSFINLELPDNWNRSNGLINDRWKRNPMYMIYSN